MSIPRLVLSAPAADRRAVHLENETATATLGARLARALEPGLLITLTGDLGVGKTTLVRAVLRSLGHMGPVRSPTFTLVESYALPGLTLLHFDCYRMASPQEWTDAGFDDCLDGRAVCLVEWAELADIGRPAADLALTLAFAGDPESPSSCGRHLTLEAGTPAGLRCLRTLDGTS